MSESLDYKQAGVDVEAGNRLVERIKGVAKATKRPEVLTGLGGFASLVEVPLHRYKKPVMVSCTDGVGTKLKLAIESGIHHTVGIDLVAMCANDLIVAGAEPLFFLDYYATGELSVDIAESVVRGIGEGCQQAGMSLVGGETAEMPGMYAKGDYDLAGFCVGLVDKEKIIDGSKVKNGDTLIALGSSGPHSNGYSLIRKILENNDHTTAFRNGSIMDALLTPTRIYVKPLLALLESINVHAMAHITGGGLQENLARVLPLGVRAIVNEKALPAMEIFDWLQTKGNLTQETMLKTFNCGIGMVICVSNKDEKSTLDILENQGEKAWTLGSIEDSKTQDRQVFIQ